MPLPAELIGRIRSNDETLTEISRNLAGDEETAELAEALSTNTTVLKLDLRYSNIGVNGLEKIAHALRTSEATSLFLCNCGLKSAKPLAQAFVFSCVLSVLDLRHNHIGDEGAQDVAKAIEEENCGLKSLALGHCGITDHGAEVLADSMARNSHLWDLDLGGNKISSEGVKALMNAITVRPGLASLDLRENFVGDEGAAFIAAALSNTVTLTDLNLSDNDISDDGAIVLASALTVNSLMKRLHLNANNIGEYGAFQFRKALEYNNSMLYLDLSRNDASKTVRQDIGKLLEGNRLGSRTKKLRQPVKDSDLDCSGLMTGILSSISDHGICGASGLERQA